MFIDSVKELKDPNLRYRIPKITNYSSPCTSSSENEEVGVLKAKLVRKNKKRNLVSSRKSRVDEILNAHQKGSLVRNKGNKDSVDNDEDKKNEEEKENDDDTYDEELEFELRNNETNRENLTTIQNSNLPRTAHNSKFNMQAGSSKV
ncbi:hypothetical protein KQX54_000511 [Cotesia glomerata]|uniref:Uncharacterized protein n=1 Tax=Cotesia glomerata TaxID=32391 RepID=A0AAV7I7T9_COTGL|nr:hypothetical protein KQX54_000511 [Cotesia glomerata]